jgi:hypothetical protein
MTMHAYRPIDADMPHLRESSDWGTDPDSGARVIRLTSSVAMSHNIYCEQPYGSPDGRRFIIFRTTDQHRHPTTRNLPPHDRHDGLFPIQSSV